MTMRFGESVSEDTRAIIESVEEGESAWHWAKLYQAEDYRRAIRYLLNERKRRIGAAQFSDETGTWLKVFPNQTVE